MDRRSFLQFAAMTGLAVAAPRTAKAAPPAYPGPFYVMISARGGWDPVYLCDPKPRKDAKEPGVLNRLYDFNPETDHAGPFSYANIPLAPTLVTDPNSMMYLKKTADFFTAHASNLVVFNGVNMATNNHDRGVTTTWSGRGDGGYPNFAALVAATRAPEHPLTFISSGGYDNTGSLVPVTRLNSVASFRKLAEPNRHNPSDPNNLNTYLPEHTFDRVNEAQAARLARQRGEAYLPRVAASTGQLYVARSSMAQLADVMLPETLITLPGELGDLQRMMQQTQLAMAAFKAGLAVGVNLELGGFDTHANHDTLQVRQLAKLLHGIDYVVQEAIAAGLYSDMVIMVGSDFGRGKAYNGVNPGDGKDHWPVSSMMFLSGDPNRIDAGRVVGGTDEITQLPLPVDPVSLDTLEIDDDSGVVLTATDVHVALREMAGIADEAPAQKFKLPGAPMPLFG